MTDKLREYMERRNFDKTPEPTGGESSGKPIFVVQKHDASNLHYDLRLEVNGALKSWAIPKGPSLNPKNKRLAVMTGDHPLSYANFEGVIPEGEYGGGTVMVWDRGTVEGDLEEGLMKGDVVFFLRGEKLVGQWSLVRLKGSNRWLLIKKYDVYASDEDILETKPNSVLTNKTLDEIKKVKK